MARGILDLGLGLGTTGQPDYAALGVPQFGQDTLGGIAHVLETVGASFGGDELPINRYYRQKQADQQLSEQKLKNRALIVAEAKKHVLAGGDLAAFAQQFGDQSEAVAKLVQSVPDEIEQDVDRLELAVGEHASTLLEAAGGDPDEALKLATSGRLEQMDAQQDNRVRDEALAMANSLFMLGGKDMKRDELGRPVVDFNQLATAGKSQGLEVSPAIRGFWRRNAEEVAGTFGWTLPKEARKVNEELAMTEAKERIRDRYEDKPEDKQLDLDTAEYNAGLKRIAAGGKLAGFSQPVMDALSGYTKEQALAELGAGKSSGGLEVEAPDGTKIRFGGKKQAEDFTEQKIAVRQFEASVNETIKMVRNNPEVLSTPGTVARLSASIAEQAKGFADLAGIDMSKASRDRSAYAKVFEELEAQGNTAVKSAQVQSMIVELAFAAAAASGQSGRSVTEKDVARFTRQIGADTGDPEQFIAGLEQTLSTLQRNFSIRQEVLSGGKSGAGGGLPPKAEREVGKVYTNSKGHKARWTGEGWEGVE